MCAKTRQWSPRGRWIPPPRPRSDGLYVNLVAKALTSMSSLTLRRMAEHFIEAVRSDEDDTYDANGTQQHQELKSADL